MTAVSKRAPSASSRARPTARTCRFSYDLPKEHMRFKTENSRTWTTSQARDEKRLKPLRLKRRRLVSRVSKQRLCDYYSWKMILVSRPRCASSARRSEAQKFAVTTAGDGDLGLDELCGNDYQLAILDVLLPKRDGFSVCQEARKQGITTPILMLTARDAVTDRVAGLNSGADDYLAKPFAFPELLARV